MSEKSQKANASSDRIKGIIFALLLVALAVCMFVWPDALVGADDEPTRTKSRLLFTILKWVWSIPGGVVVALLGALIFFGSIVKKDEKPSEDT